VFYLAAAGLLAFGAALVAFALRSREAGAGDAPRSETVAALYQDRLAELKSELAAGGVEGNDAQALEDELGAALLADFTDDPLPAVAPRTGRGLSVVLASAAALVVIAGVVYLRVGDPASMEIAGAEAVLHMDSAADQAALVAWRERLVERTDDKPDDVRTWYLLGHVDLKLGRYATAAEAFAVARALQGEDPGIDALWLQARYLAAEGEIDATTREIAERVLAQNPNHPTVLEIFALDAFRRGDFFESVSLLNRALSGSLASDQRAALDEGYEQARARLGNLAPAVDVTIEPQAGVPAGATLFVIARPPGGGGMPFAVVRRPAAGFPRTVRLDDAVSMNPAARLSSAAEVEVVVRISRAGTAMAHPGDWEWHSGPIHLADLGDPLELHATPSPPAS
jgi:cytochrome c-type biogenesis protein CcmH